MEGPEAPRKESAAASLAQAAEAHGLAVARWAGREDEERGLSLLALALAAVYFVVLFLPWFGGGPVHQSGWIVAENSGLLALAVVLVDGMRLSRVWISHGSGLLAFCLTAAAGILGVQSLANLRWGGLLPSGFAAFRYGAWIGLALALLLVILAVLRFAGLRRSAR